MKDRLYSLFNKSKLVRSFKVRIFFIAILLGIFPTIALRVGVLQNYEERAVNNRTQEVQKQYNILADHLLNYNYLQSTDKNNEFTAIIEAELFQLSNLYEGRILIIDDNFKVVKDTYGISEGKTFISKEVINAYKGTRVTNYDHKNQYIELVTPIIDPNSEKLDVDSKDGSSDVKGMLLSSVSTKSISDSLTTLSHKASVMQLLMGIILVAIAWGLSHVLVKPFEHVTEAIRDVRDNFNNDKISVPDYLETEQIVTAFNELLGRMKVLDDSRQEFVSNVSHELKTPITSIKVLADSLIAQEDVPIELYKEFMSDIAQEIERENKIINDLLSLVKMDKTAADMNITLVDINELTELILKRLKPIADLRGIEVFYEKVRAVSAEVDEVKLTLAITNLVENAIKYNQDNGFVKVTLDADHKFFTLVIEDNGIGISSDEQEHIFERFYRVDKSHSREIGGSGLGLSITRNAILMHRGFIKVDSEEGEGTIFTLRIPLTFIVK